MIRGKFLLSSDDIGDVLRVREGVAEFKGAGRDGRDDMAVYALAFDEAGSPCGCGRMYVDGDSHFRIDYLGVLSHQRKKGVGDLLMRMLIYRAQDLHAASVYLNAPEEVSAFFERYGFRNADARANDGERALMATDAELSLSGGCSA